MVVPSGKKVELVSLVMEADCPDEEGFTNIIDHGHGEGKMVEKGDPAPGLSIEGKEEKNSRESLTAEVLSNDIAGSTEENIVQHSPLPSDVPLLHEVLRIPHGQSVPLALPEEDELMCDDGESLRPVEAETDVGLPADVIVSKGALETCGPDLLEDRRAKLVFGSDDRVNKETVAEETNNSDEGEDDEEDLILSSNFVDTISEKSREEEGSSFLPPLTMTTPLKSWDVPRPLVTSTPATVTGKTAVHLPAFTKSCNMYWICWWQRLRIAGESRLSLPPPSSSPLPPPSPDGPLSLPGLVSPGGPKSYDYLLKVLVNGFLSDKCRITLFYQ